MGGDGADVLRGQAGIDTLLGGPGNDILFANDVDGLTDVLYGGTGADLFVFASGGGTEVVTDFENGIDRIQITNGATSFSDLSMTAQGFGVQVTYTNAVINVYNISIDTLTADDFIFG